MRLADTTLILLLQGAGVSLILVALCHVVLWHRLDWGSEIRRLSPLNARVFVVHMVFVTMTLVGLGVLSLCRPHLLIARSELARVLLSGVVIFWLMRLAAQPLVFNPVLATQSPWRHSLRVLACLPWLVYLMVYGFVWLHQQF